MLLKSCTNKHDKNINFFSMSFKQNKKRFLLLLIPQNKGDRV